MIPRCSNRPAPWSSAAGAALPEPWPGGGGGRGSTSGRPKINAYLKEVTGGDVSAKDFRPWNATASVALAVSTGATSPTARRRAVARAMKEVAHYLDNMPAVCRSSYVDPRVVDHYLGRTTIGPALEEARVDAPAGRPWRVRC